MSTPEQPPASEPVPPFLWPTGRGVPPGVWHVVGFLRGRAGRRAYLEVPAQERTLIAGAYVLLALWCVWGMHVAYVVPPR